MTAYMQQWHMGMGMACVEGVVCRREESKRLCASARARAVHDSSVAAVRVRIE